MQVDLIEGVRIEPPACYQDVVDAVDVAVENGQKHVLNFDVPTLAEGIKGGYPPCFDVPIKDIEKSIRIYRERNSN